MNNRNKIILNNNNNKSKDKHQNYSLSQSRSGNSYLLGLLILLIVLSTGFVVIYSNKIPILKSLQISYDNLVISSTSNSFNNNENKKSDKIVVKTEDIITTPSLRSSLSYPPGSYFQSNLSPPNMPSILVTERKDTGIYGGKIDKMHLGGFTAYDEQGVSNNTFNFMLGILGIRSVLDIGCGRGISTSYFMEKGARVLCLEGSHDAVLSSFLPLEKIVEHDFTRGPWWPKDTYDAW